MITISGDLKLITGDPISDEKALVRSTEIRAGNNGVIVDKTEYVDIDNGHITFTSLPGTGAILLLDEQKRPNRVIYYVVPDGATNVSLQDAVRAYELSDNQTKAGIEAIAAEIVDNYNKTKQQADHAADSARKAKSSEDKASTSAQSAKQSEDKALQHKNDASKSAAAAKSAQNATQGLKDQTGVIAQQVKSDAAQAHTDATNAKSEAGKAAQSEAAAKKSEGIASSKAQEASQSATQAGESASSAHAAQVTTEEIKNQTSGYMNQSKTNADNAQASANTASSKAADADKSAQAAKQSEDNALQHKNDAATSAQEASDSAAAAKSAQNATQGLKEQTGVIAQQVKSDATQAHTDATNAKSEADKAALSEAAAKKSESTASSKAQEASQSADNAAASASTIDGKIKSASDSAAAAKQSEDNALQHKNDAANSAQAAGESESKAAGHAAGAKQSEQNAAQSAKQAEKAAGGIVGYDRLDDDLKSKVDSVGKHTHVIGDITDLQNALNNKADKAHTHGISDITGLQGELDKKSDKSHKHVSADISDRVAAGGREVGGYKVVTTYADGMIHQVSDPTGNNHLTRKSWVDTQLSTKANTSHKHTVSDITNLGTELDKKANKSHTHVIGDISELQNKLDNKADKSHTHKPNDIDGISNSSATSVIGSINYNAMLKTNSSGQVWVGSPVNYNDPVNKGYVDENTSSGKEIYKGTIYPENAKIAKYGFTYTSHMNPIKYNTRNNMAIALDSYRLKTNGVGIYKVDVMLTSNVTDKPGTAAVLVEFNNNGYNRKVFSNQSYSFTYYDNEYQYGGMSIASVIFHHNGTGGDAYIYPCAKEVKNISDVYVFVEKLDA